VRPAGRTLELGGDVLIWLGCCLGPVPRPAVGIGSRFGGLGQGVVGPAALPCRRRLVDGGADQRVAEGHPGGHGEQSVCLRRAGGVRADAQVPRSGPQQRRVAHGLGSSQQQEAPGHLRKGRDPPLEALLDPAGQRRRAGHAEPAGQVRGGYRPGQLKQGQRVAAGFGDNAVADSLVEPAGDDRGEQGPGVSIGQSFQCQLGKAGEARRRAGVAGAEHHGDRFGVQPAGDEGQDLGGGLVQPLCIVDQAQQRLVGGYVRHQGQDGESDQEAVRRGAGTQAERDAERVALRPGQRTPAIQHPAAELVQPGEGQFHLRFDALSACHLEVGCRVGGVAEQRGLADTGLAAHHQRLAAP